MASNSWLELQNELRNGVKRIPIPSANIKCGSSTSDTNVDIGLPALSNSVGGVNDLLGNISNELNNFNSTVAEVLADIGAWIPPEFQGFFPESGENNTKASVVADVTKLETTTSQGGNLIEQRGHNELTGDAFWQLRTAAGAGFRVDPNGSVIISSVKNPSTDPNTGVMGIASDGPTQIKINEYLAIEVNNDNDALAAENPSIKGKAFSLVVNGNLAIEVRNGDVSVKSGGNLSLSAEKSLELRGSDIKILAGGGPGEKTSPTKSPEQEYGGLIDMRCGSYNNTAATKVTKESAKFTKIDGEYTISMNDPASIFNIVSAGDLDINVARDMLESIGGKKATTVLNSPASNLIPATPPLITAKAGYTINNKYPDITPATDSTPEVTKPLLLIENGNSGTGGVTVNVKKGDIIFSTKLGNFVTGNAKSVMGDILTPIIDKTLAPSLIKLNKPGMYVGSDAADLALFGKGSVFMTAGKYTPGTPPTMDHITITNAGITAMSKAIYLN